MVADTAVIERSTEQWPEAGSAVFQIGLVVRNECVRQGLAAMLEALDFVGRVHTYADVSQVPAVPGGAVFDILVLRFGDVPATVAGKLAREAWRDGGKVLILLDTEHEEMLDAISTIPSNGFLVQSDLTSASLAAVIARVTAGDTPMPAMLANRLLTRAREGDLRPPPPGANLTPREREVLELLVEGLSNKQIARRLVISTHGVKRLVSNVLAKLHCPNRTQAVAVALTDGILV